MLILHIELIFVGLVVVHILLRHWVNQTIHDWIKLASQKAIINSDMSFIEIASCRHYLECIVSLRQWEYIFVALHQIIAKISASESPHRISDRF